MSVTKPARWAVSPGLVDPKWRPFWRGLRVALPFWEGSGSGVAGDNTTVITNVVDWSLIDHVPGSSSKPWWLSSGLGPVFDYEVDQYHDTGYDPDWGSGGWAVAMCWQPVEISLETTGYAFGSVAEKGTNDPTVVIVDESASLTDESGYFIRDDDGTNTGWQGFGFDVNTKTNPNAEFIHTAVITCNNGVVSVYVDGLFLRSHSGFTTFDFSSYSFWVGAANIRGSVSQGANPRLSACFIWDRGLSDAEAAAIGRDPFGPIRPAMGHSRDATWQDLNPTLRAIPGAADGP